MGEYAKYKGESVKIGTCESMYYLRYDQSHLVQPESGNVDPVKDAESIRFRFPFPEEDNVEPGHFDPYNKAIWLHIDAPTEIEHYSIQFNNKAGILVSLPCPYSKEAKESKINYGFNGYRGGVGISQQRKQGEQLMLVCDCGACGAKWRMVSIEDCQYVLDAIDKEIGYCNLHIQQLRNREEINCIPAEETRIEYWNTIKNRIIAGYATPAKV